jgi:hypothetical protein
MKRRHIMDEHNEVQTRDGYDLGTWAFLRTGWWILHIIAIVGLFYLGYLYGARVF